MTKRTLNGFPVIDHPAPATFVAPNGKTVYVANDDVATIFAYVLREWHNRIEKLPPATYNTFPNERRGKIVVHASRPPGTGVGVGDKSNHRSGTAFDANGDRHHYEPSCRAGRCGWPVGPHKWISGFSVSQLATLRDIGSSIKVDGKRILRLGVDFEVGYRDGMHVEIAPGVTFDELARAAQALRGNTDPGLKEARRILTELGYGTDAAGVASYQTDAGNLAVDGKLGPLTRTQLGVDMSAITDLRDEVRRLLTINLDADTQAKIGTGLDSMSVAQLARIDSIRLKRVMDRQWNQLTEDDLDELRPVIRAAIETALAGVELGDLNLDELASRFADKLAERLAT